MKIFTSVSTNYHKKAFDVVIEGHDPMEFPFWRCSTVPSKEDPVEDLFIDPELGHTGFTYLLSSGAEGVVLTDHVLRFNRDPEYLVKEMLYDLSLTAADLLQRNDIGIRALSRRLNTSPTQIYRLVEPTFYGKSIDQMVRLLTSLGAKVRIGVEDPSPPRLLRTEDQETSRASI